MRTTTAVEEPRFRTYAPSLSDDARRKAWVQRSLEGERKIASTYTIREEDLLQDIRQGELEIYDARGLGIPNADGAPLLHTGLLRNWVVDTCEWDSHRDFSIRLAVPIRKVESKKSAKSFADLLARSKKVGSLDHRLHVFPEVIEDIIVSKTDQEVYALWKERVLGDLDSLKVLLDAMRRKLDYSCRSLISGKRSRVLCEKAGLPIEGEWTSLIHEAD